MFSRKFFLSIICIIFASYICRHKQCKISFSCSGDGKHDIRPNKISFDIRLSSISISDIGQKFSLLPRPTKFASQLCLSCTGTFGRVVTKHDLFYFAKYEIRANVNLISGNLAKFRHQTFAKFHQNFVIKLLQNLRGFCFAKTAKISINQSFKSVKIWCFLDLKVLSNKN
jgi:hypothetical protein